MNNSLKLLNSSPQIKKQLTRVSEEENIGTPDGNKDPIKHRSPIIKISDNALDSFVEEEVQKEKKTFGFSAYKF